MGCRKSNKTYTTFPTRIIEELVSKELANTTVKNLFNYLGAASIKLDNRFNQTITVDTEYYNYFDLSNTIEYKSRVAGIDDVFDPNFGDLLALRKEHSAWGNIDLSNPDLTPTSLITGFAILEDSTTIILNTPYGDASNEIRAITISIDWETNQIITFIDSQDSAIPGNTEIYIEIYYAEATGTQQKLRDIHHMDIMASDLKGDFKQFEEAYFVMADVTDMANYSLSYRKGKILNNNNKMSGRGSIDISLECEECGNSLIKLRVITLPQFINWGNSIIRYLKEGKF